MAPHSILSRVLGPPFNNKESSVRCLKTESSTFLVPSEYRTVLKDYYNSDSMFTSSTSSVKPETGYLFPKMIPKLCEFDFSPPASLVHNCSQTWTPKSKEMLNLFPNISKPLITKSISKFVASELNRISLGVDVKLINQIISDTSKFMSSMAPITNLDINCMTTKMADDLESITSSGSSEGPAETNDTCHLKNWNKELIQRKTKEMKKHSKKRRQRQKKRQSVKNQTSIKITTKNDDKANIKTPSSPKTSSRVIHKNAGDNVSLYSFMINVEPSSDDDSDWDSVCDSNKMTGNFEFEFSGLFFNDFMEPRKGYVVAQCDIVTFSSEEDEEVHRLQTALKKVNKEWNEATKELQKKPKLPTKVRFSSNIEVNPVDTYERKGEWEIYATERLHFKRRIAEMELILAPCLSNDHRAQIYSKLQNSEL